MMRVNTLMGGPGLDNELRPAKAAVGAASYRLPVIRGPVPAAFRPPSRVGHDASRNVKRDVRPRR